MKKKHNSMDAFVYVVACIITLGGVAVLRAIISTAIRKAFED